MMHTPGADRTKGRSHSLEDLTTADADAMDVALSLAPDLRTAAAVLARAADLRLKFPLRSGDAFAVLLDPETSLSIDGTTVQAPRLAAHLPPEAAILHDPISLAEEVVRIIERYRAFKRVHGTAPTGRPDGGIH